MNNSPTAFKASNFRRITVSRHAAPRRALPMPLAALAIAACWWAPSYAIDIVSIEERWELSLGEPDAAASAPQVSMVMSANGTLDGDYFVFGLNGHGGDDWAPGGMQVQQWNGADLVSSSVGSKEGTLSQTNEVVSWTQKIQIHDGSLVFEILSGQSASWGAFGNEDPLRIALPTSRANLNRYSPSISLQESGVGFAGNRVKSLTLKQLRWTDSSGRQYELDAPIDIDTDLDP